MRGVAVARGIRCSLGCLGGLCLTGGERVTTTLVSQKRLWDFFLAGVEGSCLGRFGLCGYQLLLG